MSSNVLKNFTKLTQKALKESDQLEREKVESKIYGMYSKHQDLEEIALSYLDFLSSPFYDEFRDLELYRKGEDVYEKHKTSEKIAWSYLDFLIPFVTNDVELLETLEKAEDVIKQHANSLNVLEQYFLVLSYFFNKEEKISENAIEKGEKVFQEYEISEEGAILYLDSILQYSQEEDEPIVQKCKTQIEEVYKKYRLSERVTLIYLKLVSQLEDKQDVLNALRQVYQQSQLTEDVTVALLECLLKLKSVPVEENETRILIEEGEKIYQNHPTSEKVAIFYLKFLFELTVDNMEPSLLEMIRNKGEKVNAMNEDSPRLRLAYLDFLLKTTEKENENINMKAIEQEVDGLYVSCRSIERYRESVEVAVEYVNVLFTISLHFYEKISDIRGIANKIEGIYDEYAFSNDITFMYITILRKLSEKYQKLSEITEIEAKAKIVFQRNESQFMSGAYWAVIINYMRILSNLSLKQHDEYELEKIVIQAKEVNKKIGYVGLMSDYIHILLNWVISQKDSSKIDELADEIVKICKKRASLPNKVEFSLDQILMSKVDKKKSKNNLLYLINYFFNQFDSDNPLRWSKYSELYKLFKGKRDNEKITLIDIFRLVQTIKKQLIVRDPEALTFGHYTSGPVLQAFLRQKDDDQGRKYKKAEEITEVETEAETEAEIEAEKEAEIEAIKEAIREAVREEVKEAVREVVKEAVAAKEVAAPTKEAYSIVTKSRLNNVNYMNDPSEGKVLDLFLYSDLTFKQISLKPSPWFLMCLTTAIDCLEMWAQYGEQAKGVCLVLKSDDFSKVNDSTVVPPIIGLDNDSRLSLDDKKYEQNQQTQDFIYRIGYLSNPEISKSLLEKKNNNSLNKNEIKEINNSLRKLKKIVGNIDNSLELYEEVDKCLEEIRYLFKFADYSYESELRLLKYSPLDSDNKDIKINNLGEVAKLYIERDNPIQIDEVIFGPKFPNPENVTPLLQLLDKNIKFSQSKIPFK